MISPETSTTESTTTGLSSPLHQFEIHPIFDLNIWGYDLSFTNASAFMIATVLGTLLLLNISIRNKRLVPSRGQAAGEMLYELIAHMLKDSAGKESVRYFPFVFSLFLFILGANLLGMIPYSYTVTSQIIVTFSLAMMVFILITLVGIVKHKARFLTYCVPKGVPKLLLPLIIPIELISYLSRPISLAVRLFANMMAGHIMLKVLAGFTVIMGIWGIAPIAINVGLTLFEVMVALLQAYVFTVLTCLYLHDALHLH